MPLNSQPHENLDPSIPVVSSPSVPPSRQKVQSAEQRRRNSGTEPIKELEDYDVKFIEQEVPFNGY